METEYEKEALLRALREEYGLLSIDALAETISEMEIIDIAQFTSISC